MTKILLADDTQISLPKEIAEMSGFIVRMLEDIPDESEEIPITHFSCTKEVMEHIITFSSLLLNREEKENEIKEKISHLDDELLFNLLNASNFLEFEEVLNILCLHLAEEIKKCKNPDEIRSRFKITTEFTPEEEKEAMEQFGLVSS